MEVINMETNELIHVESPENTSQLTRLVELKPKRRLSLLESHPALAAEWHPDKNGSLTPNDLTAGSGKKIWWKCEKGHEWQAAICNRSSGSGCPFCAGKKVCQDNCLTTVNPRLAKEWHPDKNGSLTPNDITYGSNKKIWWKCEKGHEWQADICSRTTGTGCPYCAGRKVCQNNCLTTVNPRLAKEWHPDKNGSLMPNDVTIFSHKKVWWKCRKGHEWQTTIATRSKGCCCPHCKKPYTQIELLLYSELKTIFPDLKLRKEYYGFEIDLFLPEIKMGIEYDGYPWHKHKVKSDEHKTSQLEMHGISVIRIRADRLPSIPGNVIKDTFSNKMDLIKSILKTIKNLAKGKLTFDHLVKIENYLRSGKYVNQKFYFELIARYPAPLLSDCLSNTRPYLANEWNPVKNGALTPDYVTTFSEQKVWWKCEKGHEWQATIANRSLGRNCPYCLGKKACRDNCLTTMNPRLAKEWHPDRNRPLTPDDVTAGSAKKVWWKCDNGHEWQARIANRSSRGIGCPFCAGKKACQDNCLTTVNPRLAKEWHPSKNTPLTPDDVTGCSGKKIWWKCEKGHEWQTTVSSRASGCSCPECFHLRNRGKRIKPRPLIK
jgi:very-short-patch-repair endonuclease